MNNMNDEFDKPYAIYINFGRMLESLVADGKASRRLRVMISSGAFLLRHNYEMAKKMTIIVKILMRSWILDKASISKC